MTTTENSSQAAPVYAHDSKASDLLPGQMVDSTPNELTETPKVIAAVRTGEWTLVTFTDGTDRQVHPAANVKVFRIY